MVARDPKCEFLIAAATARPLAKSIRNAGYRCRAIDLFADWDTQQICNVESTSSMEAMERKLIAIAPGEQIVLGSGGENFALIHDDPPNSLLAELLHGSSLQAIRRVRDPLFLHQVLREAGLPALEVRIDHPTAGHWLWKPFRSCGGSRIFEATQKNVRTNSEAGYYQQFAKGGRVLGAVYLADEHECRAVAFARQFTGGPDPFGWHSACSITSLATDEQATMERVGSVIAERTGLLGWFGIDFVVANEGQPYLIEVNPRYTSTMEIWERQTGQSLFAMHHAVCSGRSLNEVPWESIPTNKGAMVKSYLFNVDDTLDRSCKTEPLVISEDGFHRLVQASDETASRFVTDIPNVGTKVAPGQPICSSWITDCVDADTAKQDNIQFQKTIRAWLVN